MKMLHSILLATALIVAPLATLAQSSLPAPGGGGRPGMAGNSLPAPGGVAGGNPGWGNPGWSGSWGNNWNPGWGGPGMVNVGSPGWQNSGTINVMACGYDSQGVWQVLPLRVAYTYGGLQYNVTVLNAWNPWTDMWNYGVDMPAYNTSYYLRGQTFNFYAPLSTGTYYFNL